MLAFQVVDLDLRFMAVDGEVYPDGRVYSGPHFNFGHSTPITFPRPIRTVDCALKGYRFETKDDHHVRKLKIETGARISDPARRIVTVSAEAHFGDSSPIDDAYQFMKVQLLVIADLE